MTHAGRIDGGPATDRQPLLRRRPRGITAAVACFVLAAHACTAAADDTPGPRWRLAVGPALGVTLPDRSLDDYRWDVSPALQSGAQATIYRGRFAAGVRVLRSRTTQSSGIPGATQAPDVNMTSFEVVALVRAVEFKGAELWGSVQSGLLHMGYDPDRLTFDPGAGGPVTVDYDPISELDVGLGLEVRGELMTHVALSLQAEATTFALDTVHRRGNEIVEGRDRFYGWSLRLQVSWLLGLG